MLGRGDRHPRAQVAGVAGSQVRGSAVAGYRRSRTEVVVPAHSLWAVQREDVREVEASIQQDGWAVVPVCGVQAPGKAAVRKAGVRPNADTTGRLQTSSGSRSTDRALVRMSPWIEALWGASSSCWILSKPAASDRTLRKADPHARN